MSKNLILDTCALIWLATGSDRLTPTLQEKINAAQVVYVSPISAWEISLKAAQGTIELPLPPLEWFNQVLEAQHLTLGVLSPDVLVRANELPFHHRDPADRFIIATAQILGLAVVTGDRRFSAYEVEIVS